MWRLGELTLAFNMGQEQLLSASTSNCLDGDDTEQQTYSSTALSTETGARGTVSCTKKLVQEYFYLSHLFFI